MRNFFILCLPGERSGCRSGTLTARRRKRGGRWGDAFLAWAEEKGLDIAELREEEKLRSTFSEREHFCRNLEELALYAEDNPIVVPVMREELESLFGMGSGKEPGDMECDRLYRSLLERGNEEVFVPLVIDQQTAEQERKLSRVVSRRNIKIE